MTIGNNELYLQKLQEAKGPGYVNSGPGVEMSQEDVSIMEQASQVQSANDETYNDAIREAIANEENIIDGQIRSEPNGDADKFVDGQSASEVPWCAAYVDTILEESGVQPAQWYQNVCNDNNRDGVEDSWTVSYVKQAAEQAGAIISGDQTQIGDVCFLNNHHMGVVGKVEDDGTVCVVTGNSADEVQAYIVQTEEFNN